MNVAGWMAYVSDYTIQRANLKLLAIVTPHQSRQNIGSEMPIFHRDSFPPGEAKGQLRELVSFIQPPNFPTLRADFSRPYSCGGRAADGSTASRPLQSACAFIWVLAEIQRFLKKCE